MRARSIEALRECRRPRPTPDPVAGPAVAVRRELTSTITARIDSRVRPPRGARSTRSAHGGRRSSVMNTNAGPGAPNRPRGLRPDSTAPSGPLDRLRGVVPSCRCESERGASLWLGSRADLLPARLLAAAGAPPLIGQCSFTATGPWALRLPGTTSSNRALALSPLPGVRRAHRRGSQRAPRELARSHLAMLYEKPASSRELPGAGLAATLVVADIAGPQQRRTRPGHSAETEARVAAVDRAGR